MPARNGATVTARLRRAIEASDVSQAELGRRLHRSRSTLSEWKSGRSEPDLATFARLCEELGESADEVLGLRQRTVPTEAEVEVVVGLLREALATLRPYAERPGGGPGKDPERSGKIREEPGNGGPPP